MLWIETILSVCINILWVIIMLFSYLVVLFPTGVGILLVYSAITGRFYVKPLESDPLIDRWIYPIRGKVGIAFILFGLWVIYLVIKSEFF